MSKNNVKYLKQGDRCLIRGEVYYGTEWFDVNSYGTIEYIQPTSSLVIIDQIGHDGNCCVSVKNKYIFPIVKKKLWARVGMDFYMTESEYDNFIFLCKGDCAQRRAAEEFVEEMIKSGKTTLNGETYFPAKGCFADEGYDNTQDELNFLM